MKRRPRLVFISPQFLFPNDAGGKIRTTNILRGLKGGSFEVILVGVASTEQVAQWTAELSGVCDEFVRWEPARRRARWRRALDLFDTLPVNVVVDKTTAGLEAVGKVCAQFETDVVVFDFVHSAVLMPAKLHSASLCFTHNVEAEIFLRHASQALDPLRRHMWSSQYDKMRRFEQAALRRVDTVIAVSERDAVRFQKDYQVADARAIPTGVDLDFFTWKPAPPIGDNVLPKVVFTGSMDWAANIDGIRFFLDKVWPLIVVKVPYARFQVVGRSPPAVLTQLAAEARNVEFTGFVDDVRAYVHEAHVFVIPLLVGGGTRIKAFEAMAMGCPVVSTSIGMEGLDVDADIHYLRRDNPDEMASGVIDLLQDPELRFRISGRARHLVEDCFSHRVAAKAFEKICLETLARTRADDQ